MGLFDIVIVEYPLPDIGAGVVEEWQTKDFPDPCLNKYKITSDGRLMSEQFHCEDRSDPNAPKGSLASIRGCMTKVHDAWEDMKFHGILHFYGDSHSPVETEWFEYSAKFTDGKLVAIKRINKEEHGITKSDLHI